MKADHFSDIHVVYSVHTIWCIIIPNVGHVGSFCHVLAHMCSYMLVLCWPIHDFKSFITQLDPGLPCDHPAPEVLLVYIN